MGLNADVCERALLTYIISRARLHTSEFRLLLKKKGKGEEIWNEGKELVSWKLRMGGFNAKPIVLVVLKGKGKREGSEHEFLIETRVIG